MTVLQIFAVSTLAMLLAWAIVSDVRTRLIPNRLILLGLALAVASHVVGLALNGVAPAGESVLAPVGGLLAGGAALLPLYLLRACGAGDVKLMAMVGAFVGTNSALSAALYTLLAGGVLSVAVMALRGVTAQTLANLRYILTEWGVRASSGQSLRLSPLAHTAARLPYAVAVAAGTAIALWLPLPLLA